MHATCEQHTQTSISASKSQYSFSCQLLPILLLYRAQRLLAARLIPPGASRQTPHAAVLLFLQSKSQPSGLQQPHFRQPLSTFIHSVLQPSNIPHPLSPLTFHQKKTEPSAQFFPLYISSTFPGLYNPQFSYCNTKPKCLRMPVKSGSLLL